MVDNIKFNKINPYQKTQINAPKTKSVSSDEAAKETSPIDAIVQTMISDPAPPDDTEKVKELKLALHQSSYQIQYDNIAEEILAEYGKKREKA